LAIWQDYEALVVRFEKGKSENGQGRKENCTYEELHRNITSVGFILDLGLICDALQELSQLSLDLQERNIDLHKAHSKIECLVGVCEKRRSAPGPYYKKVLEAAEIYNSRVSYCIRIELMIHQYPQLHSTNNSNFHFRKDCSQTKTQNYQGVEEF
jgi:hypothetical protein